MQWADIDARHDPDPVRHCAAVAAAGVDIPLDVFEQLFHEPDSDRRLGYLLREIDWSDVVWRESQLSGAALVEVLIPREYEHAVAEARATVLVDGLQDDRPEVVQHWRDHGSWFRLPVLVTGDVIGLPSPTSSWSGSPVSETCSGSWIGTRFLWANCTASGSDTE